MADDALPWWGLRDPSSAQLIRWHWSTARLGTTSLAGLDDLTQRLAGPGERARRALLALPALALPAASLAGVGSAPTPTPPAGARSASPAVAAQALSEATCLQRFGGTTQSLGLRAEGHALSVSVRYECRLAGGSLQPLSGLPVAVHVTSAGRTSVLDARTDAEGWAYVYLTVPLGGVVSVLADVPGFPAFASCQPTACLADDPISGSLDLSGTPASGTSPSPQSPKASPSPSSGSSGTTTPTAQVSAPLSSDLGHLPATGTQTGASQTTGSRAAGSTGDGSTPTGSTGATPSGSASPSTPGGATPLAAASHSASPATGSAGTSSRPTSEASAGTTAAASPSPSGRDGSALASSVATSAGAGDTPPVRVLPVDTQAPDGAGGTGGIREGAVFVALGACAAALAVLGQRWRTRARVLGVAGGMAVPTGGFGAWGTVEIDEPPAEEPPKAPEDPPPTHAAGGGVDYWIPER